MRHDMKIALVISILSAVGILAQTPLTRPSFDAFEVATIKPTPPDWSGGRYIKMQSVHLMVARNHALKTLLAAAYNLSPQAIFGGPRWVDSDHYDIVAKTPGDARPNLEEQMSMLRKLLTERFKLSLHREAKEFAIYALTVAKNGPKLKESTTPVDAFPEGPPPLIFVLSPQGASLPGRNATMSELASVMQRAALSRPVVDQTGLFGRYDFDLEWRSDDSQFGGQGPRENPSSNRTDLFSAIQQQLGLRLEATRGPISALVIDRLERPAEN